MTRSDHDRDDDLLEPLAAAFAERGELAPTTEDEVARAEAEGVEHQGELPPELESLRSAEVPPGSSHEPLAEVVKLQTGRGSWKSHTLAALLGAAAAAAVLLWAGRKRVPKLTVGGEPPRPAVDAGRAPAAFKVPPLHSCPASCCAGAKCTAAPAALRQCASGRSCIGCKTNDPQARYRVRIGPFALSDAKRWFGDPAHATPLALCVAAGAAVPACVPAHAGESGNEPWTALPLVVSVEDAVHGISVELRRQGTAQSLARWQGPVVITPTVLCSGLALKPKDKDGKAVGGVSLFLEDTHYVQLAESDNVKKLVELRNRYQNAVPSVFETTGTGAHRFSLELGPVDRAKAESVRSALLAQGAQARIVIGDAHRGDALRVP